MLKLKSFYRDVLSGLNSMIFENNNNDKCDLNIINNEGIVDDKILVTDDTFVFFIEKSKFPFDINAVNGRRRIENNAVIKNILNDIDSHSLYEVIEIDYDNSFKLHNGITNKNEKQEMLIVENTITKHRAFLSMSIMKYFDLNKIHILGNDHYKPFLIFNKTKDLKDMEIEAIIMPVLV